MSGSRYLVVGASGGIGAALARRLHASDARLFLSARSEDRLGQLAEELGGNWRTADASSFEEAESLVNDAAETLGGLDGVVNCAGSVFLKPAHLTTHDEFQDVLARNLITAFALVRAGARAMKKSGGSIVLMSSCAARTGLPNHEAISAAKAGVIGLTQAAAATYAGDAVRVNAVAPGLVRTPGTASITSNEASERASLAMHPLGRLGEPDDIVEAIAWLMSPNASWVTGQVIGVDGGLATVRGRTRA